MTLLAAMDEDGFATFASIPNLAHRARVSLPSCTDAVACLEGPDINSSDPEFGGRRIERVDGGWIVLNSGKYKELVTRTIARERTKERVRRFRERLASNGNVTLPSVTEENILRNGDVTPSGSNSYSRSLSEEDDLLLPELAQDRDRVSNRHAQRDEAAQRRQDMRRAFGEFWKHYPRKVGRGKAEKVWMALKPDLPLVGRIASALKWQRTQPQWNREKGRYIPHAATWLNQKRYDDEPFEVPLHDSTDAAFERVKERMNGKSR